jgi:hypothetical protein
MSTFKHSLITGFLPVLLIAILIGLTDGCKSGANLSESAYSPKEIREEIRLLVDSIKQDNYIGTEQMGRLPIPAPAYLRRQALMDKAYDAELKNLAAHPNTVVSLVAFEGLYERGNDAVPELFNQILERNDILHYIRGDISTRIPMLEYAYVYVMRYPLPGESTPTELEPASPKYSLSDETHTKTIQKITSLRQK